MTTEVAATMSREEAEGDGRYEMRVWGDLAASRQRLTAGGAETGGSSSYDCYLVGPNRATNAKIRDGVLDVKHLLDTDGRLQRWRPAWSAQLPTTVSAVGRLCADLDLEMIESPMATLAGVAQLGGPELRSFIALNPAAAVVGVHKRRRHFDLDGVIGEVTEVTVGEEQVWSVAVEGADPGAVRKVAHRIGLVGENRPVHEYVARMAGRSRHG